MMMKTLPSTPKAQRGIVMVFTAIAMLVLLGMAGLALDMGHAYVNKARLQNALDAAALSGAKTLDQFPGDLVLAEQDARTTFRDTATGAGNQELNTEVPDAEVTVEFYSSLVPLQSPVDPGNIDARYVRVSVNSFDKTIFLARVLPGVGNTMTIAGSAMAGPSPRITRMCNVVPIVFCAYDPDDVPQSEDDTTVFGYNVGQRYQLVADPGQHGEVGPGNYRLLSLGGTGADVVRENLAGGYGGCIDMDQETVLTQPGVETGPVSQGLNTRFGKYQSNLSEIDYPPDTNTCHSNTYSYADYLANPSCVADHSGVLVEDRMPERRILALPVADCDGEDNGRSELPMIGTLCVFLTEPVGNGQGQSSGIWAEMLSTSCSVAGTPGENPGAGPGPRTIQLYHDPLSNES
jgi:hypothetical protein